MAGKCAGSTIDSSAPTRTMRKLMILSLHIRLTRRLPRFLAEIIFQRRYWILKTSGSFSCVGPAQAIGEYRDTRDALIRTARAKTINCDYCRLPNRHGNRRDTLV